MKDTTQTHTLPLVADQRLVVAEQPQGNLLQLVGADGVVTLSIHVTEEGPVLHVAGSALKILAEGSLAIDAQTVALYGREGLSLSTGGDVVIEAEGDLRSRARTQQMTATLGDVDIYANDDVKLDGERIRMNC